MGIGIASSLDMNAALPLDSRLIKADVTARNAIVSGSRHIGLTVYCITENKSFRLIGGIADANWVDVSAGTGTVVPTQETDSTTTGANQTATLGALMHIFTNASLTSLAGLVAPSSTTLAVLVNRRGGDLTIVNNATATAANRIITGTGADLTLKDGSAVWVVYDTVAARWQVVGGSGAGGGGKFSTIVTKTVGTSTLAGTEDLVICDASGGNITLTLAAMALSSRVTFLRTDSSANTVTINRAGSDQILTDEGLVNSVTLPYINNRIQLDGVATNLWSKI